MKRVISDTNTRRMSEWERGKNKSIRSVPCIKDLREYWHANVY